MAKRPDLLLLENVTGLLNHDEGDTFQVILESLEELGYWVEWQVLNSYDYGVPQTRRRVFIIGHSRASGRYPRPIFPLLPSHETHTPRSEEIQGASTFKKSYAAAYDDTVLVEAVEAGRVRRLAGLYDEEDGTRHQAGSVYDPGGVAPALDTAGGGYREPLIVQRGLGFTNPHNKEEPRIPRIQDHARAVKPRWGNQRNLVYAGPERGMARDKFDTKFPTLTTQGKGAHWRLHENERLRALMPVEAERLQGFPDEWTRILKTDDARYRVIGNAVAVPVIKFLGYRILEAFDRPLATTARKQK